MSELACFYSGIIGRSTASRLFGARYYANVEIAPYPAQGAGF
jgi:hypothetical protein